MPFDGFLFLQHLWLWWDVVFGSHYEILLRSFESLCIIRMQNFKNNKIRNSKWKVNANYVHLWNKVYWWFSYTSLLLYVWCMEDMFCNILTLSSFKYQAKNVPIQTRSHYEYTEIYANVMWRCSFKPLPTYSLESR